MKIIELDATKWKTASDFYDALLAAVGAPAGHGRSTDALVDSMIWGGMNEIEPPYRVRISGLATLSKDIRDHVEAAKEGLAKGRVDYRQWRGGDADVAIELDS